MRTVPYRESEAERLKNLAEGKVSAYELRKRRVRLATRLIMKWPALRRNYEEDNMPK